VRPPTSNTKKSRVILLRDDLALRQPITLPLGTPANDQNSTVEVPAAASDE
jgi:hypothetical protein